MMDWLSFFAGAATMWILIGLFARLSSAREANIRGTAMVENQEMQIEAITRIAEAIERIEERRVK